MQVNDHLKANTSTGCFEDLRPYLGREVGAAHALGPDNIAGLSLILHMKQILDHRLTGQKEARFAVAVDNLLHLPAMFKSLVVQGQ